MLRFVWQTITICLLSLFATPIAQAADVNIVVPKGFQVSLFHPGVAQGSRHIAHCGTGPLYVRTPKGVAALFDERGQGKADRIEWFAEGGGTGIHCDGSKLYVASDEAIYLYHLAENGLPSGSAEKIVSVPYRRQHAAKSIALDGKGALYVNVGAPSNSCQKEDRKAGSLGMQPCPLLDQFAGIWRFAAERNDQEQADGLRYATGVRNAVALEWNPLVQRLYLVMHGRDQLYPLFSKSFTAEDNAELPAEEFHMLQEGSNLGWPYTYFDGRVAQRMKAPEYGGDGSTRYRGTEYQDPLIGFPAHWAPNDLLFYRGAMFPKEYHGGAFIAFHGSWNRAPLPQQGYKVVFVPLDDKGLPAGEYRTFADGFAGSEERRRSGNAQYRPMGLAESGDGSLFISDSRAGRIWKISYLPPQQQ